MLGDSGRCCSASLFERGTDCVQLVALFTSSSVEVCLLSLILLRASLSVNAKLGKKRSFPPLGPAFPTVI